MNSSVGEVMAHPVAGPIVQQALAGLLGDGAGIMASDEGMQKMMASFPIGRLAGFPGLPVTYEQVEELIGSAG